MTVRNYCATLLAGATAAIAQESPAWNHTYLPYGDATLPLGPEYEPYTLDDPKRQHLHIISPYSDTPTPVYFYAHGNGGYADINTQQLIPILQTGFSVLSWESVSNIDPTGGQALEQTKQCMSDLTLVLKWLKVNAATYNLDYRRVVIGGRSRGSTCSWPVAHSGHPSVIGLYMNNALPDPTWFDEDGEESITWPVDAVTPDSPPAYLAYSADCPTDPIRQDCDPNDIHNPRHGQKIVDRYTALGIGAKIIIRDGMDDEGLSLYSLFPEFVEWLPQAIQATSSKDRSGTSSKSTILQHGMAQAGFLGSDDAAQKLCPFISLIMAAALLCLGSLLAVSAYVHLRQQRAITELRATQIAEMTAKEAV